MKFIVSQSGFIADEEEGSPGRSIEISVGEKVVILLKQYAPTTVRFSWNGKHYSASKVLFGGTRETRNCAGPHLSHASCSACHLGPDAEAGAESARKDERWTA